MKSANFNLSLFITDIFGSRIFTFFVRIYKSIFEYGRFDVELRENICLSTLKRHPSVDDQRI